MGTIEGLAQLGGTVATVVIFIYYMTKRDAAQDKYLKDSIAVKRDLAQKLQYFGDVISDLKTTICSLQCVINDQTHIIKSLYTQIVQAKLDVELTKDGKKNPSRVKAYRKALKVSEQ